MALDFTHYNYWRPHPTLTKAAGGIKTTPAMAAGLADRLGTIEALLSLMDREPKVLQTN